MRGPASGPALDVTSPPGRDGVEVRLYPVFCCAHHRASPGLTLWACPRRLGTQGCPNQRRGMPICFVRAGLGREPIAAAPDDLGSVCARRAVRVGARLGRRRRSRMRNRRLRRIRRRAGRGRRLRWLRRVAATPATGLLAVACLVPVVGLIGRRASPTALLVLLANVVTEIRATGSSGGCDQRALESGPRLVGGPRE